MKRFQPAIIARSGTARSKVCLFKCILLHEVGTPACSRGPKNHPPVLIVWRETTPSNETNIDYIPLALTEPFRRSGRGLFLPALRLNLDLVRECDESLLQCGLREVQEETGLVFTDDNSETSVLCLWESVYPVVLGLGVPTSHHIVIYLHTRVEQTWKQLQTQVQLDPGEVQACAWLSTDMVEELCTGRSDGASNHIKFISDSSGNGTIPAKLNISKMFTSLLWKCGYIYSGSQLALTRWLDLHKKLDIKLSSKI
uniref:Nudix hydrolase domain-containing protein n=1 Tax=Timema tahoe TaxID=61484 RepID=A0A7R9IB65_9NEOP|nr:unnamed protein product [Timema tahoe]